MLSRLVFAIGLATWIVVQGLAVSTTAFQRAMPPEPDDALSYIVKTAQLQECPSQDCTALEDLRLQNDANGLPSDAAAQYKLALSRVLPIYHPLLSLILLGLTGIGLNLMDAHNAVWAFGPVLFGLGFACLVCAIWGRAAAGVAMVLLAFTVLPDTGLHHVVPSNLTMAIGCLVLARIVARKGEAPWTSLIGAVVLVTMHPVGRLYCVIAVMAAALVSGFRLRARTWVSMALVTGVVVLAFASPRLIPVRGLAAVVPFVPHGHSWWESFVKLIVGTAQSAGTMMVEIVRLQAGLFGSFPFFFMAVTVGFVAAGSQMRRVASRMVLLYILWIFAAICQVSSHPGDVVLRMWIPLVAMLMGAVGYAVRYAAVESVRALSDQSLRETGRSRPAVALAWPLVLLAGLGGYCCDKVLAGAEQVYAMREHVLARQPLMMCESQTAKLSAAARPGDRVLYTSIVTMPYYFIHGAMKLGAVYYHPAMDGVKSVQGWLARPDLRFAVVLNPTVYHPSFEGIDENNWWTTSPAFRFSPLHKGRTAQPLSREGEIRAADFQWIDVIPITWKPDDGLRLEVANSGKASRITVVPIAPDGTLVNDRSVSARVERSLSAPTVVEVPKLESFKGYRIIFPSGPREYSIQRLTFGDDRMHWPWQQKAELSFMPTGQCGCPITVSFDPARLLPPDLKDCTVSVLDDCGSSALLEIHR